jgi:hypothetical protein
MIKYYCKIERKIIMDKRKTCLGILFLSVGYVILFESKSWGTEVVKDTENSFLCLCQSNVLSPSPCVLFTYETEEQCENGNNYDPSCSSFCAEASNFNGGTSSAIGVCQSNQYPYKYMANCRAPQSSLTEKTINQNDNKRNGYQGNPTDAKTYAPIPSKAK